MGVRAAFLLLYAALVAVRMPQIFLKGRFWAEEGVVYFLNARDLPWYDALFAVHTGYLNLAAGFGTLLAARAVPIEFAPWVSTCFALLIQLCPPLLLLTSDVSWLRRTWAMAIALLLLLTTTPSGEVWLNTITSQFHLGLCTALILALPLRHGANGMFRAAILILAPLSGPIPTFLAPLFFIRGRLDRAWHRFCQGALLGCVGALQVLMVLLHPEPDRGIGIGPRLFTLVVCVKQILQPFVGTAMTQDLTQGWPEQVLQGRTLWLPLISSGTCMAAIVWAAGQSRNTEVRWLLAAGVVIMTLSYAGALGPHVLLLLPTFGDRYGYVPTALFGLALFGTACTAGRWLSGAATVLVCTLIATGTEGYFSPGASFADGSSWRTEIAQWQAEPTYLVKFWPNLRWWIGPR